MQNQNVRSEQPYRKRPRQEFHNSGVAGCPRFAPYFGANLGRR